MRNISLAAFLVAVAASSSVYAQKQQQIQIQPNISGVVPKTSVPVKSTLAAPGGDAGTAFIVGPFERIDQTYATSKMIHVVNPSLTETVTGTITCRHIGIAASQYTKLFSQTWQFQIQPEAWHKWEDISSFQNADASTQPDIKAQARSVLNGWCSVEASKPVVVIAFRWSHVDQTGPMTPLQVVRVAP